MTQQAIATVSPWSGAEVDTEAWLGPVFRNEELAGLRLAIGGRVIALLVIAVLLFTIEVPAVFYFYFLLAALLVIGFGYYAIAVSKYDRPWHAYVLVFLDFALLSYALILPNPFSPFEFPLQVEGRSGNFIYFFVLITFVAYSFRPRLMIWAGLSGALCWGAGVLWIWSRPETVTEVPAPVTTESILRTILDPHFFDLPARLQELVVLLLVAGLWALVVHRSRRLVTRQAQVARERANLSRYFPPNIVEELARSDEPFAAVREQPVVVMFVDIVGFTRLSEALSAERVIEFLRAYHAILERTIFEHDGTLDKFLGDGVMATFGTPNVGSRDAANALTCARAITAAIELWNAGRLENDLTPVRVSIGIHYGPVILGELGSERRLEFAVLGDTVNVASRLEQLTRTLGCRIAVSDDAMSATREQTENMDEIGRGFRDMGPQSLRGRAQSITVWGANA